VCQFNSSWSGYSFYHSSFSDIFITQFLVSWHLKVTRPMSPS
jgi:hypothetical protein